MSDFLDFRDPATIPKEEKPAAPKEKGRGTDLSVTARQGIAGVTDVATGMPSLAGLIPAAIGASYEAATTDKPFMESFEEHNQLPFMRGAYGITKAGRDAVNKFLGIKEPVLAEDQAARLLTGTFIPGIGIAGTLANAPGKLAAAGRMLTPVMKVTKSPTGSYLTKGNVIRGGAQVGMGGTVDQGFRALQQDPEFPTMWSEEAISGGVGDDRLGGGQGDDYLDFRPQANQDYLDFRPPTSLDAPVSRGQNKGMVNNIAQAERAMHEENEREAMSDTAWGVATVFAALAGSYTAKRAIGKRIQAASDRAGPLGSSSPEATGLDKAFLEIHETHGGWNKTKKAASLAKSYLHTDWTDETQHAVAMLRSKGADEDTIRTLTNVAHSDWKSIAGQFDWTGELGQGSGIKTHAPRELRLEYQALNQTDPVLQIGPKNHLTQRQLYDLSEVARTDQTNRTMATAFDVLERSANANREIPGLAEALAKSDLSEVRRILDTNAEDVDYIRRTLTDLEIDANPNMVNRDGTAKMWNATREIRTGLKEQAGVRNIIWGQGSRISDEMLDKIVAAADADPAIKQLSMKTSQTLDALLDYRVHRGDLTPEQAQQLRDRFTINRGAKDQRLAYIPMITSTDQPGILDRLKSMAGLKTRQAKELNYAKELHQRSVEHGKSVDKPMLPLDALRRYAESTIEGSNINAYQHHTLKFLTQMRHATGKGSDDLHDLQYVGRDADGNIKRLEELKQGMTEAADRSKNTTDPQYLGYRPFDTTNDSLGEWKGFVPYPKAAARAVDDADPEVVWTMQHGRLHAWKVPDAGLRASLDLNRNLGAGEHFFRHWNSVFKAGTTGPLSMFAPVAHIFSSQQIATNVVGRSTAKTTGGAIGEGAISRWEGLQGTWELMKDGWAKERADYLAQRIADKISRGEMPTQAQIDLRNRLEAAYRNSFSLRTQKETGRTSGYIGAEAQGYRNNFLDSLNQNEANFVNHVGLGEATYLWRMWKAWNHAWHEGPAYAQMLKHYRKNIREGMSEADEARILREGADISKELAGDMRRVGSSTAAKYFNNAVPFAPAMIQSWASIGGAIKANPRRFLSGVAALVGAPTAAEVMWNFTMSSDDEVYYDENGRPWTHNEYYWKGFNAQQRASTNIVMIPGKPPWEAHQWPVSPEWGLIRGFVIDSMDAIFNFSGTRSFNDLKPEQWNVIAAGNRVLDIAMPPLFAAGFTAITGQSVRGGLSFDPDKGDVSLTEAMPIGGGSRYSSKDMANAQGAMDETIGAIFQDIFGSGGKLLVDVWNASSAGLNDRVEGSIGNAVQRGTEAAGLAINQQLKFGSSIFSRTHKLSTMQPAAKRMFRIKETIKGLQNMRQMAETGGVGDLRRIFSGSGFTNMMNDNVAWNHVALSVGSLTQTLQPGNEEITSLRKDNNSLGMDGRKSVGQVKRQIDANNAALNDIYNEQYALVKQWERDMSEWLQDRLGDPSIEINLEGDIPQSRLEGKSFLERMMTP